MKTDKKIDMKLNANEALVMIVMRVKRMRFACSQMKTGGYCNV